MNWPPQPTVCPVARPRQPASARTCAQPRHGTLLAVLPLGSMVIVERRAQADRRRVPRGGRRAHDRVGAHPTILVADAYEGVRIPAVRYLQRFHFEVVEASDGEEALQKIVATPPQVILADWSLPSMPARRLCQWLEQSWRTRAMPVIVMVADYEPGEAMPAVAGILVKPFALGVMIDEIRRVIRSQHQRAA